MHKSRQFTHKLKIVLYLTFFMMPNSMELTTFAIVFT